MKPATVGLLILLTFARAMPAQDVAIRSQAIRGQVVDARDGVPLRRARVAILSGERQIDAVFTDDDGQFAIANAPATTLTLRAAKAGFAPVNITLQSGDAPGGGRLALNRSAVVMGRVLDSYGSPSANTYVTARLISTDASDDRATQFFTRTDALGEYRLGGLSAGRYAITAAMIPPERPREGRIEDLLFGPPELLDVANRVATISLDAGDEMGDVDFRIARSLESCPQGPSVQPPEGTGAASIAGRVTSASGEPLACASVLIVAPDVAIPQVYTDRQGRYLIDGVPAGSVIVEARKSGYIPVQYGQSHPTDTEVPVAVRGKQRRTGVDIALPRQSIVTGTVVDEYGEPVEGIGVWAFQLRRSDGGLFVSATTLPVSTDDRGQYRLTGVEPATYLVAAVARDMVASPGAGSPRGYAPIFYPGTSDAVMAQRLVVDAGRDASGIDFAIAPTRTATVSGSVLDADGRPFTGSVLLVVSARSGGIPIDSRMASTDANGGFVIRNVPPGDYVVKAPGSMAVSSPSGGRQFGMQYVSVVDVDPPPVNLVLRRGATIEGRLIVDGEPGTNTAGLGVSIAPADADYASSTALPLTIWALEDGKFRASGITGPGRLTITPTPACGGCYLKSALVNGMDAADRPFDFGLREEVFRDVEIVVSDAGASLTGRAIDTRRAPIMAYSVVVFSTNPDLWYSRTRHVKRAVSGADGVYRVTGLPPGDYFVAALHRIAPAPAGETSPELLEQLATQAQRVTLNERDLETLNLRLIRR